MSDSFISLILRAQPPSWLAPYLYILLLSLVSAALLMADDLLFHAMCGAHFAIFETVYGLVIWLLTLGFWLCRQRWLVVLMLFIFMQVIQFANLEITGEPLTVIDLQNAMHKPGGCSPGATGQLMAFLPGGGGATLWRAV